MTEWILTVQTCISLPILIQHTQRDVPASAIKMIISRFKPTAASTPLCKIDNTVPHLTILMFTEINQARTLLIAYLLVDFHGAPISLDLVFLNSLKLEEEIVSVLFSVCVLKRTHPPQLGKTWGRETGSSNVERGRQWEAKPKQMSLIWAEHVWAALPPPPVLEPWLSVFLSA